MDLDIDKDLTDIRERLTLNEIKVNDHDQKINLILRSRKTGNPIPLQPGEE